MLRRVCRHLFTLCAAASLVVCVGIACAPRQHGSEQNETERLFRDLLGTPASSDEGYPAKMVAPLSSITTRPTTTRPGQHDAARSYDVIGDLTDADLDELERFVRVRMDDPIMEVRVIKETHVEVWTGVSHGPLSGGGRIFEFQKNERPLGAGSEQRPDLEKVKSRSR